MNLISLLLVNWFMFCIVRALRSTQRTRSYVPKLRLHMASSAIDVNTVRSETMGCNNVIHLNAAGASLMPGKV